MSKVIPLQINAPSPPKFKVVVLECPYDSWKNPTMREMFVKLIDLKFDGYRKEYPYGVLPVDTTDFFATHHLVCEETESGLLPLMAYKTVTLDRCKLHNSTLPVLNLANVCGIPKHASAIREIISRCESTGAGLSYDSSWTIHPDARKDESKTRELRNIMMAIHALHHEEAKTGEIISLGALRFKMEKLFGYWGYSKIALGTDVLDPFRVPSYFNEEVIMIHMKGGFSKESLDFAETYRSAWTNRLIVGAPETAKKRAAA